MMQENFFSYEFSKKELSALLSFFRENDTSLPHNLESFYRRIEKVLYESLTIEEIENIVQNNKTIFEGEDFYG